ncbi:unnamed protein product [Symbiodinium sp. CCMP2592]|nr:unnamed protein product [Symbiodinium sp. CCMP2592]CAE7787855.1 unnamed protein product [Symbiodinium sp. CCMP2592]
MRRTDQAIDSSWTPRHLTAFADDFHLGAHLRKVTDLDRAPRRFGCFLNQLIESHLLVNEKKSAFLLRLTRGFAPSWVKSHIRKGPEGRVVHFCTPAGRTFDIPLKEEHVYLGLTISYYQAVSLSVEHRIAAAWSAWTKLRPLLTSASAPALDLRLRLWRACLPPTLLYGLHILPLNAKQLGKLQAVYTKQLRAVSRSQSHLTFESTPALHTRLGVPTVCDSLLRALGGLRERTVVAMEVGLESTPMVEGCDLLARDLLMLVDPGNLATLMIVVAPLLGRHAPRTCQFPPVLVRLLSHAQSVLLYLRTCAPFVFTKLRTIATLLPSVRLVRRFTL